MKYDSQSNNQKLTTGSKIKHYRKKLNLTQSELADKIGVGPTAISNYESDYSLPRMDVLSKMSKLFSVDIDLLVSDDTDREYMHIKMAQNGYNQNSIPFYSNKNFEGIKSRSRIKANSFIELPSDKKYDTSGLICTQVCDNSVFNSGIPAGSYIIINPDRIPHSGNIVCYIDETSKELIIRIAAIDGPLIHLSSNGHGDNTSITIYENDPNYTFVGTVVSAITKLIFFDD